MAYIYQIVNDINNKIYVGKTENTIEERFKQHCHDSKRARNEKRPLYDAMNKYGIEHFHIELIEETDNPEEREIYWIQEKDSFKNGYNATIGGDGKRYLDYDLIFKTYQELKSAEKVAKLLNISKDSVLKIAHQHNQIYKNNESIMKSVAQIDKNTDEIIAIFPSIAEAEKAFSNNRHIANVCRGKRKTAYGYKWKYI